MNKHVTRTVFLDLLRIIACFLVIVNHTNSAIFLSRTPDSLVWYVSISYFFISKVAVPIFFMISGYLLLGKIDNWKKSFSRILRMLIILLCCAIVYALFNIYMTKEVFSISKFLKEVLFVYKNTPSGALWYLYTYIGLLIMLPFLQKMSLAMKKTDFHLFFAISAVFYGILPIFAHYSNKFVLNSDFSIPLFSSYILMAFIGQYFSRFEIKKTRARFALALLIFILTVVLNVVLTLIEYQKSPTSYLFFDNRTFLPIILESVCLFYMVSFVNQKDKPTKIISKIGACTFGIYLVSDMCIRYFKPIYNSLTNYMHELPAVIIFEVLVFTVGLVVTVVLRLIPYARKIL